MAATLGVCLLAGLAPIASGADGLVVLRVGGGRASCNTNLDVPVDLKDPNGLGALDVVVSFDPEGLEFRGAEKSPLLESAMFVHRQVQPGKVRCGLISTRPIETEGTVFSLHFHARGREGQTTVALADPRAWQAQHAFALRVAVEPGTWDLREPLALSAGRLGWIAAAAAAALVLLLVFLLGRRSAGRTA